MDEQPPLCPAPPRGNLGQCRLSKGAITRAVILLEGPGLNRWKPPGELALTPIIIVVSMMMSVDHRRVVGATAIAIAAILAPRTGLKQVSSP